MKKAAHPLHQNPLAPSAQFKREAARSVAAILAFIAVYLLLFTLSLALAGLCLYGGFALITLKPSFYTLLIGLGIIGCGIMLFIFLVKFLFASAKPNESDSIEVTEADQPQLFQTVYALAEATGTAKPKKIFLSPDVNAAVFYHSSFWSLFLPVRKNLKIGLGLVNALNTGELKAVIAHEFGHFSQRSMKLGSWVYQVNKIIHDMLFNNQGYANSLAGIAEVHGVIAFFVQLTVQLVKAIQWVLRGMYAVVNRSYLGLSRQMEFHADLVAASVCGSNNIISALKRSEFADACFTTALSVCTEAWQEKKAVQNFYASQGIVARQLAQANGLPLQNGLPVIDKNDDNVVTARIQYKDQWASHPTLSERSANLEPFGLLADAETEPAWNLFANEENWKEELTRHIYKAVAPDGVTATLNAADFETLYTQQVQSRSFPPLFNEFYNGRSVTVFDAEAVAQEPFTKQEFAAVFTEERRLLPKRLQYLERDLAVLEGIQNKEIGTASFDFDGRKHNRKDAALVRAQLEGEKEALQNALAEADRLVFRYFYAVAPLPKAEGLKEAYKTYFGQRQKADAWLKELTALMERLGPVFGGQTLAVETIQEMMGDLKQNHEPTLKKALNQWLLLGAFAANPKLKAAVEKFTLTRYEYFSGTAFFDNELLDLNNTVQAAWNGVNDYLFALFKTIAETQAALEEEKQPTVSAC